MIATAPEQFDYPPFPSNVLPTPLHRFIQQGAAALDVDPAFVALPLLSGLASAVGATRRLRIRRTWAEPCIVWTCIVGESGSVKSPAQRLAQAPLWEYQARAFAAYDL